MYRTRVAGQDNFTGTATGGWIRGKGPNGVDGIRMLGPGRFGTGTAGGENIYILVGKLGQLKFTMILKELLEAGVPLATQTADGNEDEGILAVASAMESIIIFQRH